MEWIVETVTPDLLHVSGRKFTCPKCGWSWGYGTTPHCPDCGVKLSKPGTKIAKREAMFCPYCQSVPYIAVRVSSRDCQGRASGFLYQYRCENKACEKKPIGYPSADEEHAEWHWNRGNYTGVRL